ncbi:MAG: cyclic nucleotide-gated ion channel/potassium channel family protein [Proteobacteria bacterium]|nr:cyclic nucleotide-gated ion channel/potassium channel family protein [Pseudomonadota bacterium]
MARLRSLAIIRRRTYEILDVGSQHDPVSRIVHRALVALVLLSVAATILESIPALHARYRIFFQGIEFLAGGLFTLEYLLRIWATPEHPPLQHFPVWRARINYAGSPAMIIDLLAIVPFYLAAFTTSDFEVLVILRFLRFYKLARYSPGMRSLIEAVQSERRALIACLIILGGLMIIAAAIMHAVEGKAQPDKFGTIPEAMYWAIITLTTVGYGDAAPITPAGKLVAGGTAVMGLVMLSLPVGIIATAFAEVIHRRDFVVTWNMVSRVPLFSRLDASEIAAVMRYLRSRAVEAGDVVVHRDDPAQSMYFISAGAVEVELPDRRIRLDEGHFFGEIAILRKGRRSATVRALEASRLLVLDREDLLTLMEQNSTIAEHVQSVAQSRLGPHPLEPSGDITEPEITP